MKKIIYSILLSFWLFSGTSVILGNNPVANSLVFAQGETNNPQPVTAKAPFFPGHTTYTSIGDYVSGFYTFSIWLVTIISVIMIIWGAYLIITSSGNPESVKKGREIIISSLASLGILLMATVILGIINPQIIQNPWVRLPNYGQNGSGTGAGDNAPVPQADDGTITPNTPSPGNNSTLPNNNSDNTGADGNIIDNNFPQLPAPQENPQVVV